MTVSVPDWWHEEAMTLLRTVERYLGKRNGDEERELESTATELILGEKFHVREKV